MSEPNLFQPEVMMMKLEKLIQERESISAQAFPVSTKELLARYERLYTGAINDVLRELCLLDQALPYSIVPLRNTDTIAGIAFTVKSAPSCLINGEMDSRAKMLGVDPV